MNNLNDESIKALQELGEVLRTIHNRLINQGYVILQGQIYKPTDTQDMKEDLGSGT